MIKRLAVGIVGTGILLAGCSSDQAEPAASTSPPASAASPMALPAQTTQALEAQLTKTMARNDVPGAAVEVCIPGYETWATAEGLADIESQTPMTTDMYWPLRSVTKSYTVTMIMQLVDEGKISLDDTIDQWIPDVPNGDEITLRQLADMGSGAPGYTTQAGIEDPGHLHGQRRATRDDPPVAQHLAPGAQQRHGIDAGVLPEPAILVGQQRLHVQRRDPFRRGRIAPNALRIGERAQGAAIACQDHDAGIAPGRPRQREQQVEQQQGRQQGDAAPAQPGQQASCPAHSPACGRGRG